MHGRVERNASLFQMTSCWNYSWLNCLLILLLYSLSLVPLYDLCRFLCCSPHPILDREEDILKTKRERKARGDYFEVLPSPRAQQTSLLATWGMLPCFWKAEKREGATWPGNLCPISLPVCRNGCQCNKLQKYLLFTVIYSRAKKKGDVKSISTQICFGLNLIANFKKIQTNKRKLPLHSREASQE